MKKVIIQICCFNEEHTLEKTIADLPTLLPGCKIEILILDDGSTDRTIDVAKKCNVNYIIINKSNMGLAYSFLKAIRYSLEFGADVIVHTDGDNQYCGSYIEALANPIICDNFDLVIGERDFNKIDHFSFVKIKLQNIASFIISKLTGLNLLDVTSGFRAYSKDYAKDLNVFTNYTYTLETIISAAFTKKRITTIKISTNAYTRESRLIKSNGIYILKSIYTVFRVLVFYRPIRVFSIISSFIFLISILSFFLISNFIFSFLLFGLGFHVFCIGLIIDAIRVYNIKKNYGITEQ